MAKIKSLFIMLRDRWKAKTPLIFSRIIKLAMAISTIAIAIQTALVTAGADIPEWWSTIFPYFVGTAAGMVAVAKLTQQYDRNGNPVKTNKRKKQ